MVACVLFELRTEFLHIMYMNVGFKWFIVFKHKASTRYVSLHSVFFFLISSFFSLGFDILFFALF